MLSKSPIEIKAKHKKMLTYLHHKQTEVDNNIKENIPSFFIARAADTDNSVHKLNDHTDPKRYILQISKRANEGAVEHDHHIVGCWEV